MITSNVGILLGGQKLRRRHVGKSFRIGALACVVLVTACQRVFSVRSCQRVCRWNHVGEYVGGMFCQVVDYMACSVAYLSHVHSPA